MDFVQRLIDFGQAVTRDILPTTESQEIDVVFERTLGVGDLPKRLKALFHVAGVDPEESLDLRYSFRMGTDRISQMKQAFLITRTGFDRDKYTINAISVVPSRRNESRWEIYLGDEKSYLQMSMESVLSDQNFVPLFSRFRASEELLADEDFRLGIQEELISLLDLNAEPTPHLHVGAEEPDSLRRQRLERWIEQTVETRVQDLLSGARQILEEG